jgi:hypothetical protein
LKDLRSTNYPHKPHPFKNKKKEPEKFNRTSALPLSIKNSMKSLSSKPSSMELYYIFRVSVNLFISQLFFQPFKSINNVLFESFGNLSRFGFYTSRTIFNLVFNSSTRLLGFSFYTTKTVSRPMFNSPARLLGFGFYPSKTVYYALFNCNKNFLGFPRSIRSICKTG